ncbi:uncharacterized protein LOC116618336 isoform X2 [Nematostella vectensis]|uniref:uncharacterized protein LOC116618336 isoform X2 n=1 Tax=Nematostella vectensis TaxID=45351 RepID=UPI00207766E8|nr:uncharacterized protein LOC116618336 isoform X2 [Nematostella vectensis]
MYSITYYIHSQTYKPIEAMESKRLLVILVVCFALVAFAPSTEAQGLRWGREYDESPEKLVPMMKEYIRRQEELKKKREFSMN